MVTNLKHHGDLIGVILIVVTFMAMLFAYTLWIIPAQLNLKLLRESKSGLTVDVNQKLIEKIIKKVEAKNKSGSGAYLVDIFF